MIKNNTQIKSCHHVIENTLTHKNNPDRTNSYRQFETTARAIIIL